MNKRIQEQIQLKISALRKALDSLEGDFILMTKQSEDKPRQRRNKRQERLVDMETNFNRYSSK